LGTWSFRTRLEGNYTYMRMSSSPSPVPERVIYRYGRTGHGRGSEIPNKSLTPRIQIQWGISHLGNLSIYLLWIRL